MLFSQHSGASSGSSSPTGGTVFTPRSRQMFSVTSSPISSPVSSPVSTASPNAPNLHQSPSSLECSASPDSPSSPASSAAPFSLRSLNLSPARLLRRRRTSPGSPTSPTSGASFTSAIPTSPVSPASIPSSPFLLYPVSSTSGSIPRSPPRFSLSPTRLFRRRKQSRGYAASTDYTPTGSPTSPSQNGPLPPLEYPRMSCAHGDAELTILQAGGPRLADLFQSFSLDSIDDIPPPGRLSGDPFAGCAVPHIDDSDTHAEEGVVEPVVGCTVSADQLVETGGAPASPRGGLVDAANSALPIRVLRQLFTAGSEDSSGAENSIEEAFVVESIVPFTASDGERRASWVSPATACRPAVATPRGLVPARVVNNPADDHKGDDGSIPLMVRRRARQHRRRLANVPCGFSTEQLADVSPLCKSVLSDREATIASAGGFRLPVRSESRDWPALERGFARVECGMVGRFEVAS